MSVLSFSSGRVFAVYTDGVVTHGAIFRRKKGAAELVAEASSGHPDPTDALAELIAQLGGRTKVPKTALFASDRGVLVRAELPVDPDRPRKYEQMRELARWEAEPAFSDLPDWKIGDVLLTSGAINEKQREEIEAEIALNQRPGSPAARFQDVAMRRDVIDRVTRDLAIATQETLAEQVTDAACAWSGFADEKAVSGPYIWLVSALSETSRQSWVDAFKAHKIKIPGLLPGWGLCPINEESHLVLERHQGAIFALTLNKGRVERAQLNDLSGPTADEIRLIDRILDANTSDRVTAIGFPKDVKERIRRHEFNAEFVDDWVSTALFALGRHALEGKGAELAAPMVALREPAKPLLKNPDFYRIALVTAVVLSIAGYEIKSRLELDHLKQRLSELDEEFTEKQAIANQIKSNIDRVRTLKDEAHELEEQIASMKEREQKAIYLQQRRAELPIGILEAVRNAAHPGLVMRSISESDKLSEIYIASAWSISEVGAELFISDLNRNLSSLGLSVADESVFKEPGLRGIDGYGVSLRIARAPGFVLGEVSE
ncbi:MAG: hypothetical protein AAF526_06320 [Pseudomonadota bacterium]